MTGSVLLQAVNAATSDVAQLIFVRAINAVCWCTAADRCGWSNLIDNVLAAAALLLGAL
jgi:hypothetical protein